MASPTRAPARTPAPHGADPAFAWVAHLRGGGTEPWTSWRERHAEPRTTSAYAPGAQQLELLRRLNLAASSSGARPPSAALAERVIEASAPGRGIPDLPLRGSSAEPHRFGPRPVDPAELAPAELVRVASGLLAEDLAAAGPPPAEPAPRRRPWARAHRIAGDPWLARPAAADLARRGHGPGGRRPVLVLLGTDLPTMLAHAWTVRSLDTGAVEWADWLAGVRASRGIPRRADLLGAACRATSRGVDPAAVRVVLDPAALPREVGTRRPVATWPSLGADAADLARRIAAPLGGLVLPRRRAALLRHRLLPRLRDAGDLGGRPLTVPPRHAAWVARRAARMRDGLLDAGVGMVGDPDRLLRAPDQACALGPDDRGTLDLALHLLLEGDRADRPDRPATEKGPHAG